MDNDTSLGGVLDGSLTPLNRATSQPEAGRACTCHPDDNPPVPCPQKYALSECRKPEAIHSCSYHCERPECVRAQRDELRAWRDAVDRELTVIHSTAESYATPLDAVRALIDWHCAVAIDPRVSSEAEAMVERGREEMRAENTALRAQVERLRGALEHCLHVLGDLPSTNQGGTRTRAAYDAARAALAETEPKEPKCTRH